MSDDSDDVIGDIEKLVNELDDIMKPENGQGTPGLKRLIEELKLCGADVVGVENGVPQLEIDDIEDILTPAYEDDDDSIQEEAEHDLRTLDRQEYSKLWIYKEFVDIDDINIWLECVGHRLDDIKPGNSEYCFFARLS